jgi:hypothetical protein
MQHGGHAVVEYGRVRDAEEAVYDLSSKGFLLDGQKITVEFARELEPRSNGSSKPANGSAVHALDYPPSLQPPSLPSPPSVSINGSGAVESSYRPTRNTGRERSDSVLSGSAGRPPSRSNRGDKCFICGRTDHW